MEGGASYIYHLNSELLESERIFKLSSAILNRDNTLVITLILRANDYDLLLTDELREKVETITRKLIPPTYHTTVLYKKTISDESYIIKCVNDFIYEESPLVYRKMSDCDIAIETGYDTITVRMCLPPYVYSFMENNGYAAKLATFLESKIMEHIEVALFVDNKPKSHISMIKRKAAAQKTTSLKVIEVSDLESVVGAISRMPKYISEALKAESDNQTVCGKVTAISLKIAKTTGKPFLTMKLDDTTGQIEAVYFPRDEKAAEIFQKEVPKDTLVCAEGPVKLSNYNNNLSLQIRRISRCKINYASIQNDIEYLEEEENYITVFPVPYVEEEQAGLFDTIAETPEDLKGDFVVFDLETTGLNPTVHKIIEIGAIKMRDGKMIESFSTLINPQCPIPEGASETNHIYDKDVANAPTLAQVIGDFYKFTRGAVLAGHNIDLFDCNFLSFWGKQYRYHFDNPTVDTLKLAKEKKIGGKLNLSTLCKKFDIPFHNAHRAFYDAEVTAKLLKKLVE